MNTSHSNRDRLPEHYRENSLLVLRSCDVEHGCRVVTVGMRSAADLGLGWTTGHPHANALKSTREHELFHDPGCDVVGTQVVARRRELDLFRPQYRDDFVLAPAFQLFDATRVHRRRAEADALLGLLRKQQVRGAEEGRDETRRGTVVKLVGLARFEMTRIVPSLLTTKSRFVSPGGVAKATGWTKLKPGNPLVTPKP